MWKIAPLLMAGFLTGPPARSEPQKAAVECYCTDRNGGRVELGQSICILVDGRMFMAQCQMSLNVPMWREISDGCPASRLRISPAPVLPTNG